MLALSLSDKFCCFSIFIFVFVNENHTGRHAVSDHCNTVEKSSAVVEFQSSVSVGHVTGDLLSLVSECGTVFQFQKMSPLPHRGQNFVKSGWSTYCSRHIRTGVAPMNSFATELRNFSDKGPFAPNLRFQVFSAHIRWLRSRSTLCPKKTLTFLFFK